MANEKRKTKLAALIMALVMALSMMSVIFAACGSATISLDKTEAALYAGDTLKLTATVSGDDDADVEWTTSDTAVATVRRGTVTAVAAGTAVITASIENGATATCNITVTERTVTISRTTAEINLDEGNTLTLTATASDNGAVTWSSSNYAVATVDNGVVTALDIGTVTITASRGKATATCEITVTEPSRPADYYWITKLTNAEVVADPGVWHYHADGSMGGDYNFETNPLHRDATASVTLNVIPNVANKQYFYFRYQPNQVDVGKYYTMKLDITVSSDATLRIGSKGADEKFAGLEEDFTANQTKQVEYIGYRNEWEPFSVRVNSEVEAETLTLKVKLVSVEQHDGENLPDYHFHEETPQVNYEEIEKDTSSYALEAKTNIETLGAPGKWYYNQGAGSTVVTGDTKYDNGTITFKFDTLATNGDNQLRYRPDLTGDTKIKVEFTVTGNAASSVVLALCNVDNYNSEGWTERTLTDGGTETFSAEFTIKDRQIIFIQIKAKGEEKTDAAFTISNIKISREAAAPAPDGNSYDLNPNGNGDGSKANVCKAENCGKWFYMVDGYDESRTEMTAAKLENGTLTWSFTKMEDNGYYLRIQPEYAVGTAYKISFDLVLNRTGTDTVKPRSEGDNKYEKYNTTAGETLHIDFTGTVCENNPFAILLNITDASEDNPIVLTISNITIVAV